ncbi:DUF1109 domain-containing protein, partial [Pyxidicoccus fallax]|nr:DUF1109 domain-containing protein [Pyxidicoccus fallax]
MKPECSRVMDSLGGPLPADLSSHVATCADCRSLLGGFDALGGAPVAPLAPPAPVAPSPGLDAARQLALKELATRPKATPWWHELLVLLAVHAVVLVGGLLVLGRHGIVGNRASPLAVMGVAALTLVLVGGGTYVALAPLRRRWPWTLVLLAAGVVAAAQV